MPLEGLHHVTCITADAPANVEFYAGVLGLRLVKKTVNFDAPDVYHLYYGDERGAPGSILTFFEFPDAGRGRAGPGQVHRIDWQVSGDEALDFWERRLEGEAESVDRADDGLVFRDFEGLTHALLPARTNPPLTARVDDVRPEHALQGFLGVRAYAAEPEAATPLLEAIGLRREGEDRWVAPGDERTSYLVWDRPPAESPVEGAGSVHHIAWNAADDPELELHRDAVDRLGGRVTAVIDRQYFHSIYFRVPAGVLFELATRDIGFAVDEDPDRLGLELRLPPQHEDLRDHLERHLAPLPDPRARR